LVTNQPNRVFLRNWREALEVPKSKHVDTFDKCGNLFGAGIPVNLEAAIRDGLVASGDVIMMAAFAHAGDFAGAAAVRGGGPVCWLRLPTKPRPPPRSSRHCHRRSTHSRWRSTKARFHHYQRCGQLWSTPLTLLTAIRNFFPGSCGDWSPTGSEFVTTR